MVLNRNEIKIKYSTKKFKKFKTILQISIKKYLKITFSPETYKKYLL